MLERALINVMFGDGCFWKHPESVNYNLVWTSINRPWLEWKQENLLPDLPSRLYQTRKAGAKNCFANSKALFELKTHVHPEITEAATTWVEKDTLARMDMLDLAIWYLDDGCCIERKDAKHGYRVIISVGSLTADTLFPPMRRLLGTKDLGRVYRNNSKATEKNKSWIIPKAAATQILSKAREIAPICFQKKVPLW